MKEKGLAKFPITDFLAATSVGKTTEGELILDLDYIEDSSAAVDMNVVMTGAGEFVELQGTGEEVDIYTRRDEWSCELAEKGIPQLIDTKRSTWTKLRS